MNNSQNILIVEDEKPLARALELKLDHEGFNVTALENGEGVLDMLGKESFSLIICDLVMPRVDGFHVLEALKKAKKDIPIFILTNLGQPEDEKRARDLGANEFFIKSDVPVTEVVNHVKKYLQS